ncbi:DnaJ family domain-containing protein [Chryseomicrobium sp. FSL W7-1435]|uniref:DnaJ family domain-containing protein n=1 Tax=Chryseomicrobium sp. FSL W7-1435 TaxID=2921704 RepID=UPI00315A4133
MTNDKPQYNDLIGDIVKEYAKTGGMDNLPGMGKPLSEEYLSGDVLQNFQRIAKEQGYKPYWLELQHVIRDDLIKLNTDIQAGKKKDSELRLKQINDKIFKYNQQCPPPMQKGSVRLETLEAAVNRWN